MTVDINTGKHCSAYPSKTLSKNFGRHIYNIQLSADYDNGNIIARGDYIALDLYGDKEATKFSGVVREQAANGNWYVEVTADGGLDALFVYNVPESPYPERNLSLEKTLVNKKGDVVAAYELAVGDIVEVSVEGFEGTPSAGATVNGVTNHKMTIA